MENMINAYSILVGKPEGRRSHGRPGVDGRIILASHEGLYSMTSVIYIVVYQQSQSMTHI
jgi:hypothetical protein